jgi:hypothetical protein
MPIKRFPDDLDSPPGSGWPGWEHQHERLEMLVDTYVRETDRYDIQVRIQRMGGLHDLEISIYDAERDVTYYTEAMYADPKKLDARLQELRPKLESGSALEQYVEEFRKKYGKKPDSRKKPDDRKPEGPGKKGPPGGKK